MKVSTLTAQIIPLVLKLGIQRMVLNILISSPKTVRANPGLATITD